MYIKVLMFTSLAVYENRGHNFSVCKIWKKKENLSESFELHHIFFLIIVSFKLLSSD